MLEGVPRKFKGHLVFSGFSFNLFIIFYYFFFVLVLKISISGNDASHVRLDQTVLPNRRLHFTLIKFTLYISFLVLLIFLVSSVYWVYCKCDWRIKGDLPVCLKDLQLLYIPGEDFGITSETVHYKQRR